MAGEAAAATEPEIAITIVADDAANVDAATTPAAKKEDVKVEVEDPAVQDLMTQYKELETRAQRLEQEKAEARREAEQQRQEADSARKQASSSHLDTITTALTAAQEDAERAKRDIRAARASGDIDAETDAQDRLARARATEMRLDEAKQDMEARAKAPPRKPAPPSDPVEAYVQGRTEPTARWLRAHPDYITDARKQAKLTAAHYDAESEGFAPDTAGYFAHVEKFLGLSRKDELREAPTEAAQVQTQPKRSAAPPVAPGTAVAGGGAGNSPTVQLTAREAAAAQDGSLVWNWNDPNGKFKKGDPIGIQEFARRKLALQKNGAYDRSYSEG